MATKERRSTARTPDRRKKERQSKVAAPSGDGGEPVRQSGDGTSAPDQQPGEAGGDRRRDEIARAAYYKAQRRGFDGNREVEDWLEAEREIDSRAAGAGIQHEASVLAESTAGVTAPAIKEVRKNVEGEVIDPEDLQSWAKKLQVPAPRLREAIQRVGTRVSEVKLFLGSGQQGG